MRPVIIPLITAIFSFLLLTNCTKENTLTDIPVNITTTSVQEGKGENLDKAAVVDFQSYVQEEMQAQYIPTLSVLIFEEEEILYEGCFGKSNLEEISKVGVIILTNQGETELEDLLLEAYEVGIGF